MAWEQGFARCSSAHGVKSLRGVWYQSDSDRYTHLEDRANTRGTEPDVPGVHRFDRWRDRGDALGESRADNRAAGDREVDAGRRAMRADRRRKLFSVASDEIQHARGNFRRGEFEGTRGRRLSAGPPGR